MEDLFSEPVRTSSIEGYTEFKDSLIALGAKAVGLSGGATQFAICHSREVAELVINEAENFYKDLKVKHIARPNSVKGGVVYEIKFFHVLNAKMSIR